MGSIFPVVGKAQAINGTTQAKYTLSGTQSISNTAYYRLKLITIDNSNNTYSRIIRLYNRNASFKITAVNRFKNILKLVVFLPSQGNVEFNLCDIYGNVVNRKIVQMEKGNSHLSFDNVYLLPAGIYILTAAFNGHILQYKLLKTN